MKQYSWREFGHEAEFVVASYLKSRGWSIKLSPSSRGAADIVADKNGSIWCIQVKASTKSPHIKSEEIKRLKMYADANDGIPVFTSVQPWRDDDAKGASLGEYMIFLYCTDDWSVLRA